MDEKQEIEFLIEKLRTRLHAKTNSGCLTDPEIVKASQELNEMLNEYERLISRKCKLEP